VPVDTVAYGPADPVNNLDLSLTVETPRLGPLSLSGNVTFGRDVNYFEWSPANIVIASGTAQLRPTSQLRLDGTYIVQAYDRRSDGSQVGVNHIPRLRSSTRSPGRSSSGSTSTTPAGRLRDDGRTNDRC
jgi:hypothetical protein